MEDNVKNQNPSLPAFVIFLIVCCLFGAVAGFAWSAWGYQEDPYVRAE
jgi:hypothetical protein